MPIYLTHISFSRLRKLLIRARLGRSERRGFTAIELIIVMAVFSIVLATTIPF